MSVTYYRDLLLAMLPPGAFNVQPGGIPYVLATGMATAFANAADLCEQAQVEVLPHSADEMLDEWEWLVRAPSQPGLSSVERQFLLIARWRMAIGLKRYALRSVVAPALRPTHWFRDTLDDNNVSWRFEQEIGNGTIVETTVLMVNVGVAADGRWTSAVQTPTILYLPEIPDRGDDYTLQALLTTDAVQANCAAGLCLFESHNDAFWFGPWDDGGGVLLRHGRIEDGVVYMGSENAALPVYPFWLTAGKEGDYIVYRYGASLGALTDLATILPQSIHPRRLALFAWNDNAGHNSGVVYDTVQAKQLQQHNNVETIEMPLSLVPVDRPTAKFFFFIHRDPTNDGSYSIKDAQVIVDKAKSGHTLGLVGESDCFRWDDPYSLWYRDIWR